MDNLIELLNGIFKVRNFSAGSQICSFGITTSKCESFLLISGIVNIELCHADLSGKVILNSRTVGEFIGENTILQVDSFPYQVTAKTDCQAFSISLPELERLNEKNPLLTAKLYRAMTMQMAKLMEDLYKLAYEDLFKNGQDQTVDQTVSNAKESQEKISSWTDSQLDAIITDISDAFKQEVSNLMQIEIAQTKIGNITDKKHKLNLVINQVLHNLLGTKTQGKINDVNPYLIEYASPVGVIFAVIPVTNPVSNSLFKALLSIKTRNALIVSYPRVATDLGQRTVNIIRNILNLHGAPVDLVQQVPLPASKMAIKLFMSHRNVNLILATGGQDLVRAAYSSGNPAYGVGPGNVPVLVSKTAKIDDVVKDIIKGKSYDNGIVCGSESNLIVNNQIKEEFIKKLESQGAAVLTPQETQTACEHFFNPETKRLKREFIGLSGQTLADAIKISRDFPVRLLVIPVTNKYLFWLGKEKMAPILAMYFVNDHEGIDLARQLLIKDGAGHTAVIHSQDPQEIDLFAQEIPTGRLLVNTPSTHGMLGETTGIGVSFMLGSGTYGRNITTDGISWRHLINIKRLAFDLNKKIPV